MEDEVKTHPAWVADKCKFIETESGYKVLLTTDNHTTPLTGKTLIYDVKAVIDINDNFNDCVFKLYHPEKGWIAVRGVHHTIGSDSILLYHEEIIPEELINKYNKENENNNR